MQPPIESPSKLPLLGYRKEFKKAELIIRTALAVPVQDIIQNQCQIPFKALSCISHLQHNKANAQSLIFCTIKN